MRHPHPSWTAAIMLLVLACGDSDTPTATLATHGTPTGQLDITNPPCTVRWASAVSGNWTDATKWNPAVAPSAASNVCIDAVGSYIVTLDPVVDATPVDIASLDLGAAGASPTLRLAGTDVALNVAQGIVVAAGATMELRAFGASALTATGGVMNTGTFSTLALCGNCGTGNVVNADFDNRGTLLAGTPLALAKVNASYVNTGTITIGNGSITIPSSAGNPTFVQNAGLIDAGTSTQARITMAAGTFTMNGGETQLRMFNPIPIVVLDGASLVLGAGATSATALAIRVGSSATPTVTGDIPALTQLWVAGSINGLPGTVDFIGSPVNFGTIRPQKFFDAGTGGDITLGGSGRLRNAGTIDHSRNGGASPDIRYTLEVTNDGTMNLLTTNATFAKVSGQYVNNGVISLGVSSSVFILRIPSTAALHNSTSGTITGGTLSIDGGRVFGDGPLNTSVHAINSGVYDPGLSTAIVNVDRFNPGPSGILRVEIGGPIPGAQHDRVNVTGSATLDGQLDVVAVGGQAGFCGQRFDVLTHSSGGSAGNFSSYSGLVVAPNRWLRPVHLAVFPPAVSRVALVGYDPTQKACVGPSAVAVAEGGASVQYSVVLDHAPTATVTVAASPDAQVSVTPASLVFNAGNWQVPQSFSLSAIDDLLPEGPHTGVVSHTLSTTDASFAGFVPGSVTATIADNDVNLPPTAGNDAASTNEDIAVIVPVLANDSDPEGATLVVTAVSGAVAGTTQITGGGTTVTYTPAANVNGQDSFTYTVSDGTSTSNATVTITVIPVNDAPSASDDQASATSGQGVVINVLANDADIDGNALTITQAGPPANGTVIIAGNGQSVTYTSSAGFSGQESFGYTVSDGQGGTASATVIVTVTGAPNQAPVAAFTQACTPRSCRLDASASTDDHGIVSYQWSAGSSGRPAATGITVNRRFSTSWPNSWQETLTVTDAQGLSHSVTQTVTIPTSGPDLPPVADFTITCTATPRRCVLDASISTDDHGIVSYAWSAGSSGRPAASGQVVRRAYSKHYPNTWQETLTVTDASGQTSSITKTVTVP